MVNIAIVGAGQFAGQFAHLFDLHPGVGQIVITDLLPERAAALASRLSDASTRPSFEAVLEDPTIDAVALFTQRWTHGPLVVQALETGKHVYSAVPMAVTEEEVRLICDTVARTRLTYMMGETSYYNPATVYVRQRLARGDFGRVFYSEGDYVHDMDLGFYDAYRYSGGAHWRQTASYPPMLYATHSVGGVLGALHSRAVAVSCIGVHDDRNDGVFDRDISQFQNDISNATALFELADGGVMRINEMRRVGYPSHIRESRFRFFGTEASFEQLATVAYWQTKDGVEDISELLATSSTTSVDDPSLAGISPALRDAFVSGHASVHDVARLPADFHGAPNGHEGSHQFLVDDFVTAVNSRTLPVLNAWTAARFTLPGIVAHESALAGGVRLPVPDLGGPPADCS